MLRYIAIENFALISRLQADFGPGLNLITGETGSGKSILVDAVSLLAGGRASLEMVRQGCDTARVEGLFELPPDDSLRTQLTENGIDLESGELIVRREISVSGSNRIYLNDRLCTLALLAEVGPGLVDIHGQHSQQHLLAPAFHLDVLDSAAGLARERASVEETFHRLDGCRRALQSLRQAEKDRLQRIDLLRFQLSEIDSLEIGPGLDESLEAEKRLLSSAEARLQASEEAYQLLYEAESSVVALLDRAQRRLQELAALDPATEPLATRLEELRYAVEEISFETRDYGRGIQYDPTLLERLEERLAELSKLKRKYGPRLEDVLSYREEAGRELAALEHQEVEADELEDELLSLSSAYNASSQVLREIRTKAAEDLSRKVVAELTDLAMKESVFEVRFEETGRPTPTGLDQVEFYFSANPGEEPRPLTKVASGGELSRLMLALKRVAKGLGGPPTLVFDEIDAGIGGRAANRLGEKLAGLAQKHQVFCVTHLPQIAAFATHHFHVDKVLREGRTLVELRLLDASSRVEELSRMLAGDRISETTRRQAAELLQSSRS